MINKLFVGLMGFSSVFSSVFMQFDWLGGLIVFVLLIALSYLVVQIMK